MTTRAWAHAIVHRYPKAWRERYVSGAEAQIRSNEKWVQGCRDMISKGVPSPLNDALAQVGKWTVKRDSARARLKELGSEARFRGSAGRRESGQETAT